MTFETYETVVKAMTRWANEKPDKYWMTLYGHEFTREAALKAMKAPESPAGKALIAHFDSTIKYFGMRRLMEMFAPPEPRGHEF